MISRSFTFIIPLLLLARPVLAQDGDLVRAYQKEFAFLQAEKEALQDRLRELEAGSSQSLAKSRRRVESIQGRLLSMQRTTDRMEAELYEADRRDERIGAQADVLGEMLARAHSTVGDLGVEIPDGLPEGASPSTAAAAVRKALTAADELLDRGEAVRRQRGAFFLPNGSRTEGELVHVGRIASYGRSGEWEGSLVPAGEGRLKLLPEGGAGTAAALLAGNTPERLGIFLFEGPDNAIELQRAKTPLDVVGAGGVIAWVIVILGLGALAMILARIVILWRAGANMNSLVSAVSPLVARGRLDDALKRTRKAKGVAGRVLGTTIRNLDRDRDHLEDIVSEAILHESPNLERFGAAIAVFAAVAPLLGLLGTVTGMIATFDVITEFGTGDPKLLSGGISEALITTELGLIVAIPTLLIGTVLSGRADGIQATLERSALHVMNLAPGRRAAHRAGALTGVPAGAPPPPSSHPEAPPLSTRPAGEPV